MLASLTRGDLILCQITSHSGGHPDSVAITTADFMPGGTLPLDSFALPHRMVTANESVVRRAAGRLTTAKLQQIRERVCAVIRGN